LNIYETDKLLAEYLLFHYGTPDEILPYAFGPHAALDFPTRCVTECFDFAQVHAESSALDLGCAVGRATFELARFCGDVVGIDRSEQFIRAARTLAESGRCPYRRIDEGTLATPLVAHVPADIDRGRVRFQVGDATNLQLDHPPFDLVLMANLIDRVNAPRRCLAQLGSLVKSGGQLVITSPYTWLEEFTPRDEWLGGFARGDDDDVLTTLDGLQDLLDPAFSLVALRDLPFLIREHARKFQWSVAQASTWIRK
jgi:putative 4-mercaptohistidine N1-methyltranferase